MKYNILKLASLLACFTCLASTAGNAARTSSYEEGDYTSTFGGTKAAYEGESETGHTGYAESGAAGVQHGNSGIAVAETHGEGVTGHTDGGLVVAEHKGEIVAAGGIEGREVDREGNDVKEDAAGYAHAEPGQDGKVTWDGGEDGSIESTDTGADIGADS